MSQSFKGGREGGREIGREKGRAKCGRINKKYKQSRGRIWQWHPFETPFPLRAESEMRKKRKGRHSFPRISLNRKRIGKS